MKRFLSLIMIATSLLAVSAPALAAPASSTGYYKSSENGGKCDPSDITLSAPINGNDCLIVNKTSNPILAYMKIIIDFAVGIFGILAILMVVISGVQYTTSAGNPQALAAAKGRLSNAVLGLVMLILMVGVLNYLIPGGVFSK